MLFPEKRGLQLESRHPSRGARYEELDGWREDLGGVRSPGELPENALRFVRRVEELTGVPVWMVSVGPARDMYLELAEPCF